MGIRHLYVARHGEADAFGELTDVGRRQADLLGVRLAAVPVGVVRHSPLPRASATAHEIARHLPPGTPVAEAAELVDHVPYIPGPEEVPAPWAGFFDGYEAAEVAAGRRTADQLTARFLDAPPPDDDTHEVLVTHGFQIAWMVRHALGAPPIRWLGLDSGNTALTMIEQRPGLPPGVVMFNDMSHLPTELRWTGFPGARRP
ncbi:histidine phosphatase family protein [Antribacter gilvus]|uniref:histidine phosphatase family protein n=1 Tax=Antribacter gilvus TaxID=2304675 RepID=UPI000F7AF23B|nr:histidine phosphatase family protein [Antribacter gilvus]